MRLSEAAGLLRLEQAEPGAPPAAPTPTTQPSLAAITSTDDVAPYPLPLGARGVGRRRRRRLPESTNTSGEHPQVGEVLAAVAVAARESDLGRMRFSFEQHGQGLDLVAPTGRRYVYRYVAGYVVMTEGKASVKVDDRNGIVSDAQAFMAWMLPPAEDGIFVENVAWKIASESVPYVTKLEAMLEVKVIAELSVERPLDEAALAAVAGVGFEVVSAVEYRGGEDLIDRYATKHGVVSESKVSFQPLNAWSERYVVDQDVRLMVDLLVGTKVDGHEAVFQEPSVVAWGDAARLRIYREFPSILEVSYEGRWCCVHVVPSLPSRREEEYLAEVVAMLPSLRKLKKSDQRIDAAKLLDGLWVENADQGSLGPGCAYHKDGQWGIDYATTGMGQGNPDNSVPNSSITNYRWNFEEDGVVHLVVDSCVSRNASRRQPSPSTLDLSFHPSLGLDGILSAVGNFTYCT